MSELTDESAHSVHDPHSAAAHLARQQDPKRWWALGVIGLSQLMVILDATIVNIALPHATEALHIAANDRQWLITAYALPFGALLLLGGRIADWVGRKKMLIIALCGFAVASAIGGAAQSAWMLFAARALQGVFGSIMAPAALALITVTFVEAKDRAKAFAVFGAIAGGGSAVGLLLGGVLTSYIDWRWCLFVNIPIAVVAAALAIPILRESHAEAGAHYDILGAILATVGLAAIVWGFTRAPGHGWVSFDTLGWLIGGVLVLGLFVVLESRSTSPLLPLRILKDRNRGGAYLVGLFVGTGLFGVFLFLTYFIQGTLLFSPIKAGFAFLPFSVGVVIGAGVGSQLVLKIGPRVVVPMGLVLGVIGLGWLATIDPASTYWGTVFPAELIISLGMGFIFMSTTNVALVGVSPNDAGVASAMVNTAQQIGGSLGTALLSTVAASATTSYFLSHAQATPEVIQAAIPQLEKLTQGIQPTDPNVLQLIPAWVAANVHGYSAAFWWAGGLFLAAAAMSLWFITAGKNEVASVDPAATVAG